MNCFIKVNSSLEIGSGHFVRCLNLARILIKNGCQIYIISNQLKEEHISKLNALMIPHLLLNNSIIGQHSEFLQIREYAKSQGVKQIDWIIVDDYGTNNYWDKDAKEICSNLCVIEDLHKSIRSCDLLLDMNYRTNHAIKEITKKYTDSKLLLGPQFALLDERYAVLCKEKLRQGIPPKHHVLINFGSVDDYSLTLRAYIALIKSYPELKIKIIIQKNNKDIDKIRGLIRQNAKYAELFVEPEFLGDLISDCTISIGAGGISLWERYSLGIYSLSLATVDNQLAPLQELHKDNLLRYLGEANAFSEDVLLEELSNAISANFNFEHFIEKSTRLCDGRGAERVCEILMEPFRKSRY